MPNYFHLLLTIENEMTIERAVQFIKGGFSFRAGKELGMRSPIWQKGFSRGAYLRYNSISASSKLYSQ